MEFRTLDPASGRLIERFPWHDEAEVERRIGRCRPGSVSLIEGLPEKLVAVREQAAATMTLEMGKPQAEALAEIDKCIRGCETFVELAGERFEATGNVRRHAGRLLAIMPWNFPFWQVFRCILPTLAAGGSVLLKHAPSTPRCAMLLESLFDGELVNLFVDHETVARLIADDRVRAVSLTGSSRAGKIVGALAGAALKPAVLELGGSDPYIVFADADLDRAAEVAVTARCQNAGQSCIAAKRFLVQREVFDPFVERFVDGMSTKTIGPLAREDLRDTLHDQVQRSDARLALGGAIPDGPGFFYPPTVLLDVDRDSAAMREELFGPVAPVVPFEDEGEALAIANDTEYGLGASVWTGDGGRAERMIAGIDTGAVFVNAMVASDPALPFGGVKMSGVGKELGPEGMDGLLDIKTVWKA